MAVIGDQIEHEIRIEAPPGVVFTYLTDAGKHVRWLGTEATLDPVPGGVYRCVMDSYATVSGNYVAVEEPRDGSPGRVAFTWGFEGNPGVPPGSSTVEITLTGDGDGTLLRLVHTGLAHPALAPHDEGWTKNLAALATVP
jgi:uncharacterized protein YndB with AHSA1/START domain